MHYIIPLYKEFTAINAPGIKQLSLHKKPNTQTKNESHLREESFLHGGNAAQQGEEPWHDPKAEPSVCAQHPPAKRPPAPEPGVWEADVFTLSFSCSTLHEIIQHELDHRERGRLVNVILSPRGQLLTGGKGARFQSHFQLMCVMYAFIRAW